MSVEGKSRNQDYSMPKYSEENFTAYSIKIIEYLCKRHKQAIEAGQPTDFNIDEIWVQDLKPIVGGAEKADFRDLLNVIQDKTGYLEIRGNIVRLSDGKNAICAEVGIILNQPGT
jgi:hypothetical protein